MSQVLEPVSRQLWSDWLYERVPLPPIGFGVLLAGALLGLLALLGVVTGALDRLAAEGSTWWRDRNWRVAVLLSVLAGIIPTALRFHELGTRRNLEALARANLWSGNPPDALRRATCADPRAALLFGATGFLLLPAVAYSVDRDAGLYFTARYWELGQIWTWLVGSFVTFTGGILTYRAFADARTFARLARALPEVDLLERDALLPFAHQGMRSAVPGVIFATFLLLNLGDEGYLLATVLLGGVVLAHNAATLLLPLRGVHDRLRAAKREELARVNAAIRGAATALRGSLLRRRENPTLSDLLAWRRFVESVPEWPIDVSTLGRSVFYVGIPLLSWVGAALVQHAIELAIE